MGNPTMWFEVAAKDREAMKGFYGDMFEWEMTDMEEMPYTTIENNGQGIPGGIASAPDGEGGVTFYVEVADVEAGLAKAESLGGARVMGPMELPRGGKIGLFSDPEGHVVGVMNMNGSS
jgi:uncharacterized protein